MPTPITAAVLYDLVECEHRVARDLFDDPAQRDAVSPFVQLLWEKGFLFEREVVSGLEIPFLDLSEFSGAEKERRTRAAMAAGEALIYSPRIASDDLLGEPDFLRRERIGYTPIDIKSGRGEEGPEDLAKPKVHYAVQLAIYVDILERLGASAGRRGVIWDIEGKEVAYLFDEQRGPRTPESWWDYYRRTLERARVIVAREAETRPAYASGTCKNCYWYSSCVRTLERLDDLTLIPWLGRSLRDTLLPVFPTVADFAAADPEGYIHGKKTDFTRLGPDRLRTFQARARLIKAKDGQPYLREAVRLPHRERELFFDIEDDPFRDHVYLHGIVERNGGDNATERYVAFFADEVSAAAERQAFQQAFEFLNSADDVVIYYYARHERTKYRALQQKYPDVCSADDIETLYAPERAVDLYTDVVLKATEWPTRDYSIKTLARYLGFDWRDTHPSGAASIEWFHRWVDDGDPALKQRILDYNEDDCRATRVLLDGIRGLAVGP